MNNDALVECVPNFSEGRDKSVIDAIANAISQTPGCYLLDVDPGTSTNRTVYTFVAHPDRVMHGALAAARVAHKLIDMSKQKGEHPRIGAMDVCPFIPVKNTTIEECIEISKKFGKLLADELQVPVYLYGETQPLEYRKELSSIRQGEYEGLKDKIVQEKWRPDFGPASFVPSYGASCVGARQFLIAYNINVLGTKEQAHRIALNVREQGRSVNEPGRLKKVKAIGWFLEEENLAQISMNLTDYKTTNLHEAFEECEKDAHELRVSLCGSQIVGLIPLDAILMAADHYIQKEGLLVLDEEKKVKMVTQRLGLSSLAPFNPKERVIEYIIKEKVGGKRDEEKLQISTVREFIALVGARTSLPGGGCVAALVSSLGSALACMVSYLTYGTRKYENVDAPIRKILPAFHSAYHDIAQLIDQDAISYNKYMESRRLPETTEEEKTKKKEAIERALLGCIEVPFNLEKKSASLWPHIRELAPIYNLETKSDLLVGIKCLETGIFGAYQNVLINMKGYNGNNERFAQIKEEADKIWLDTKSQVEELMKAVESR